MIAWVLSGLFLSSAVGKLVDLPGFRLTVRELLLPAPRQVAHATAFAVLSLELVVVVLFLTGSRPLGTVAAGCTILLAGMFGAAFFLARRLPEAVPCRCFGAFGWSKISYHTVVTSALLIVVAVGWLASAPGPLATLSAAPARFSAVVPGLVILILQRAHRVLYRAHRVGRGHSW